MIDELINPFIIKELTTKVELYPYQMNSELYLNLKKNLKKKLEGKCNKYGYVHKIIKINEYSDGYIDPENFSANGVYNIRYIANICVPLVNTKIIACIENFNKHLILTKNGPINAIIKVSEINNNIFTIKSNGIFVESLNKNLEIGDYIKIIIKGQKFSPGDNKIGVIASIDDIASDNEVKEFYNMDVVDKVIEQIDTDHIEINEDVDFISNDDNKNIEIKTNYSEI